MRLESLSVAGFRGFNSVRTIEFDPRLTLLSAPNSHGKTSITEALELLFYGQTSKVESADSKDEYRDSYRNRHYPADATPYIEARCVDASARTVVLRMEIHGEEFRRFVDGDPVATWPFEPALANAARPFVVQHALKRLLLAPPTDRFQGFAQLLGLKDIDTVQQALVNLCTKPNSHLSPEARSLLSELDIFLGRLKSNKATAAVAKALSRGSAGIGEGFEKLVQRGQKLAGKKVAKADLSAALVVLRNAAAAKVYSGSVEIQVLSTPDQNQLAAAAQRIESVVTEGTVEAYGRLAVGDATTRIKRQVALLGLGLDLIQESPDECPLCEQDLDETRRSTIRTRHEVLSQEAGAAPDIDASRAQLAARLKQLVKDVELHCRLQSGKSTDLINANTPEASTKIGALIGKGHEDELFLVAAAGAAIKPRHIALNEAANKVTVAAGVCTDAIHRKAESVAQVEELANRVASYLAAVEDYTSVLREVGPTLEEPSRLLKAAVDALAGTAEFSLLIEVMSSRHNISKGVKIREVLDSLKDLRKHVDQAVGQTMQDAFSNELTQAVMSWYGQIRTTGDPDVHFSGFSMERTKAGAFKSRKVRVAAHSYGVELASAVSSLSESKLNALGLCMSIATALRAPGPWSFLILDDPIQSWDDDHEFQFIGIVRRLVEEECRQIILMSHRDSWIDQVVGGCRSLNGKRYHIASYDRDGPTIHVGAWAGVDQRLREALGIANDSSASTVKLQHAEEELRIAVCQLASEAAKLKLGRTVGAHSLNRERVRTILTEAGCDAQLRDRVVATFTTTDDAHHAPRDYEPSRERIRQYHGALSELRNWMQKS